MGSVCSFPGGRVAVPRWVRCVWSSGPIGFRRWPGLPVLAAPSSWTPATFSSLPAPGWARVAYVDNDPVVLTHARALLATDPRTIVIEADMREPAKILHHVTANEFVDLDQPVAVLMVAILHFLSDIDRPAEIVTTFRERIAPGSYLVISHATAGDMSPQNLTQAVQTYATTSAGSITPRSPEQIRSFFEGLELQEPGLVPVAQWRPEGITPARTSGPSFLGGIARKT
jgi:hypothetical protein